MATDKTIENTDITQIDIVSKFKDILTTVQAINLKNKELTKAQENKNSASTNARKISDKQKDYENLKKQLTTFEEQCDNIKQGIDLYYSKKEKWSNEALDACKKAALLGAEVIFSTSGIKVMKNGASTGLFSDFDRKGSDNRAPQKPEINGDFNLTGEIGDDFKNRITTLFPTWYEMAKAFWNVWSQVDKLPELNNTYTCEIARSVISKKLEEKREKLDSIQAELNNLRNNCYGNPQEQINILNATINELNKELEQQKRSFLDICSKDPVISLMDKKGSPYDEAWLDELERLAQKRTTLFGLLTSEGVLDLRTDKNIYISPRDNKDNDFVVLLATYLLAFPPMSLAVDIIEKDPAPKFAKSIDKSICNILDYKNHMAISEVVSRLKNKYVELEPSGNNNDMVRPSQLTVFYGYDGRSFETITNELKEVITNGPKRGLYFIIVGAEGFDRSKSELLNKFNQQEFRAPKELLEKEAVIVTKGKDGKESNKTTLGDLILHRLSQRVKKGNFKVCPSLVDGSLYNPENRIHEIIASEENKNYNPDAAKISVPIAFKTDGSELNIDFTSEAASSTFIVGQTGSGKSYLLHSILSNMMLKYDTSAVELILMDFKTKGVELNEYKGVPHVSHLLVNGNDKQIVQEILKSVVEEMEHRGEVFSRNDCQGIADYNSKAKSRGLKTFPYMIMVVDECSGLFESDNGVGMQADEVKKIITKIAKEGRSQGIFMILATQTFHGSGIPGDVIKQFSTFLLMRCTSDDVADLGINDNDLRNRVTGLRTGEVVMHFKNTKTEARVYDYKGEKSPEHENGEYWENTKAHLLKKSNYAHPEKEQFYFSSDQRKYFEKNEFTAIAEAINNDKICLLPGRRISTDQKPVICELKQSQGHNLLILGANGERQAERVLWASVISAWKTAMARDKASQFYIFDNNPGVSLKQSSPVNKISELENVLILPDKLKLMGIGDVFADVLLRKIESDNEKSVNEAQFKGRSLAEMASIMDNTDGEQSKKYTPIFLILPNHDTFLHQLSKDFVIPQKIKDSEEYRKPARQDAHSGSQSFKNTTNGSNGFLTVMTSGNSSSTPDISTSEAKSLKQALDSIRTYADALYYILNHGSEVGIHVLLQTSELNKIIPDKRMTGNTELNNLFSEMIMLRMPDSAALNLGFVNAKVVSGLSARLDSLRALRYCPYASSENLSYFIPFDFPKDENIVNFFKKIKE